MTISIIGKLPTAYDKANRYIEKAQLILRKKAGKKDGEYAHIKYVKTAGEMAYIGVLLAVDEYLMRMEGNKFTKPESIEDYRICVAKHNENLLSLLNQAYAYLYIVSYFHGVLSVRIMKNGIEVALKIIEYIK